MGADDLVMKPFAFSELSMPVRARLRRGGRSLEGCLRVDDLGLNRAEQTVKRGGRGIDLTPKELALSQRLMRDAGQNVTRVPLHESTANGEPSKTGGNGATASSTLQ